MSPNIFMRPGIGLGTRLSYSKSTNLYWGGASPVGTSFLSGNFYNIICFPPKQTVTANNESDRREYCCNWVNGQISIYGGSQTSQYCWGWVARDLYPTYGSRTTKWRGRMMCPHVADRDPIWFGYAHGCMSPCSHYTILYMLLFLFLFLFFGRKFDTVPYFVIEER